MDDILVESDIKTLKILSQTESKCSIKNPTTTYDHVANAYMYTNSSTLSKQKFQEEWIKDKKLGVFMLTQFAKSVVSNALEKFKKSSKQQQTLDNMFDRLSQKKKVRMIYSKQ